MSRKDAGEENGTDPLGWDSEVHLPPHKRTKSPSFTIVGPPPAAAGPSQPQAAPISQATPSGFVRPPIRLPHLQSIPPYSHSPLPSRQQPSGQREARVVPYSRPEPLYEGYMWQGTMGTADVRPTPPLMSKREAKRNSGGGGPPFVGRGAAKSAGSTAGMFLPTEAARVVAPVIKTATKDLSTQTEAPPPVDVVMVPVTMDSSTQISVPSSDISTQTITPTPILSFDLSTQTLLPTPIDLSTQTSVIPRLTSVMCIQTDPLPPPETFIVFEMVPKPLTATTSTQTPPPLAPVPLPLTFENLAALTRKAPCQVYAGEADDDMSTLSSISSLANSTVLTSVPTGKGPRLTATPSVCESNLTSIGEEGDERGFWQRHDDKYLNQRSRSMGKGKGKRFEVEIMVPAKRMWVEVEDTSEVTDSDAELEVYVKTSAGRRERLVRKEKKERRMQSLKKASKDRSQRAAHRGSSKATSKRRLGVKASRAVQRELNRLETGLVGA